MAKVSGVTPENILEVAEAIISLKGFHETSLKDIAHAAGISKGTLYYYYSSKEALIYDIAGRHFDEISARMIKWIEAAKGTVGFEEILRVVLENIVEDSQVSRINLYLLQQTMTGDKELKEKFSARYKEWIRMIADVIGRLFGKDEEVSRFCAQLLLALMEGYSLDRMITDDSPDFGKLARYLSRMLASGEDPAEGG